MPTSMAWHLTFNTYGSWLPGDPRGYINRKGATLRERVLPGDPWLHEHHRKRLKHPPLKLDAKARRVVREAIEDYCKFKDWSLLALNVRTNHVHVIVGAAQPASRMLNALKGRATRLLRESKVIAVDRPVWSERGSKTGLTSEAAIREAIRYVLDNQGVELPEA